MKSFLQREPYTEYSLTLHFSKTITNCNNNMNLYNPVCDCIFNNLAGNYQLKQKIE